MKKRYILVNHGIESVKHLGYDIEAPDYDRRGHFFPNVHEEDVQEEVERRFPHLNQRDIISMVLSEHENRGYEPLGRPFHSHIDKDDEDDDDEDDYEDEDEFEDEHDHHDEMHDHEE